MPKQKYASVTCLKHEPGEYQHNGSIIAIIC